MSTDQSISALPNEGNQPKKKFAEIVVSGFALFSMFFGAGNLIFPLIIGHASGQNNFYAFLGLSLSAVLVPFLGLFAMMLYEASYDKFFLRLGRIPGKLILIALIAIQGPFGTLPRLFTLMHATLKTYIPTFSLPLFSLFISLIIFALSYKPGRLIKLLGVILTPILFLSLICFVFFGISEAREVHSVNTTAFSCFKDGLIGGYNTTDLLASFLFASLVLPYLKEEKSESKKGGYFNANMLKASLLASLLLLLVYAGLSYVSAYQTWTLGKELAPEEILGAISGKLLGKYGAFISSIAIFFACLTTAMTLLSVFASYLKKEILKEKISDTKSLGLGLLITFGIANLGFSGIAKILSPILQILYPGLIVLCILNILHRWNGVKLVRTPVFAAFLIAALVYLFS